MSLPLWLGAKVLATLTPRSQSVNSVARFSSGATIVAMASEDRRARERAARRQLIVDTARQVAETEGWDAVTTRRLSTEIEYSQPVLYKHFSGMDAIAEAVAIDGFAELTDALRDAGSGATKPDEKFRCIAHAYIESARDNPAVYD